MEDNGTANGGMNMTALQRSPAIPAHPNIVEMVTLLEDPNLQGAERSELRRELHDTVLLVKKRDGKIHAIRAGSVRRHA